MPKQQNPSLQQGTPPWRLRFWPPPQTPELLTKDFCLQPGLDWKFLLRRTWSGQKLLALQFWKIVRCWGWVVRGERSHRARNPEKLKATKKFKQKKVTLGIHAKVTKKQLKSNKKVTKTGDKLLFSYFFVTFACIPKVFFLLFKLFRCFKFFGVLGSVGPFASDVEVGGRIGILTPWCLRWASLVEGHERSAVAKECFRGKSSLSTHLYTP